jgi:chemotaxis regulatin CheY-phosphate phosphatase CheZ
MSCLEIFTKADVQLELLEIFVQLAGSKNVYPIVVIDVASAVLGDEIEATKSTLRYFVSRTKQNNELSLILISSEHGYPYQLEREGLNLQKETRVIFAGEIPPSDMRKLMVDARYEQRDNEGDTIIGMGPRLAELCLAVYGGHFLTVKNAIALLSEQESQLEALSLLPDHYQVP